VKDTALKEKVLLSIGAIALLLVIFGVPAVLVPFVMNDIPSRAMTKVISQHAKTVTIVEDTFARQTNPKMQHGRLSPLPDSTRAWIALVNPMNRKAPGGGAAVLPESSATTGAIGLTGNTESVTITLPAYRELDEFKTVISPAVQDGP
jgi:hypothetical protein